MLTILFSLLLINAPTFAGVNYKYEIYEIDSVTTHGQVLKPSVLLDGTLQWDVVDSQKTSDTVTKRILLDGPTNYLWVSTLYDPYRVDTAKKEEPADLLELPGGNSLITGIANYSLIDASGRELKTLGVKPPASSERIRPILVAGNKIVVPSGNRTLTLYSQAGKKLDEVNLGWSNSQAWGPSVLQAVGENHFVAYTTENDGEAGAKIRFYHLEVAKSVGTSKSKKDSGIQAGRRPH